MMIVIISIYLCTIYYTQIVIFCAGYIMCKLTYF